MSRSDVRLLKSAMSLLRKDVLQKGATKVVLISGGGSGHEYVTNAVKIVLISVNFRSRHKNLTIALDLRMEAT